MILDELFPRFSNASLIEDSDKIIRKPKDNSKTLLRYSALVDKIIKKYGETELDLFIISKDLDINQGTLKTLLKTIKGEEWFKSHVIAKKAGRPGRSKEDIYKILSLFKDDRLTIAQIALKLSMTRQNASNILQRNMPKDEFDKLAEDNYKLFRKQLAGGHSEIEKAVSLFCDEAYTISKISRDLKIGQSYLRKALITELGEEKYNYFFDRNTNGEHSLIEFHGDRLESLIKDYLNSNETNLMRELSKKYGTAEVTIRRAIIRYLGRKEFERISASKSKSAAKYFQTRNKTAVKSK